MIRPESHIGQKMIEELDRRNYSEKLNNKTEKEINDLTSLLTENPNPVFRVSNTHSILYANKPGKILLKKLEIKSKKIPQKLINSVTNSIKPKFP